MSTTHTYLIIHFSGDLTPEDVLDHLRKIIKLGEEKFGVKARLILCNVVGFGDYALRSLYKLNQYRGQSEFMCVKYSRNKYF